ncbi:uncharacterized protein LOC118748037 [Rhagoletis pomonella]|uniref:uncharacterized protein LOC118748037 n=1 Tax=Rhagoletis pomonella TaxID=28610 RepID=UPI0017874E08|nr:uncharacterized protein LOC118748037 [Rhagoletis pomonella]
MQRSICAIVLVLAVVNAAPYGSSSGGYASPSHAPAPIYSREAIVSQQGPSVLYDIPAPAHWNLAPAAAAGPVLTPVNAHHISGSGTPSSLVGISSQPSAIAAAASANVPLNADSYKLLIVPSYEVPNIVGPEPALPAHRPSSAGIYGIQSASY